MGFRLGDIMEHKDAGAFIGVQREIACDCWFTSKGKTKPRMIKVLDEEGIVHTIDHIEVLYSEDKNYSGVATVEHVCRIYAGDQSEVVKLVFRKENCTWNMVKV